MYVDEPKTFTIVCRNSKYKASVGIEPEDTFLSIIYKFKEIKEKEWNHCSFLDRRLEGITPLLNKNFKHVASVMLTDDIAMIIRYFIHTSEKFEHHRDTVIKLLTKLNENA